MHKMKLNASMGDHYIVYLSAHLGSGERGGGYICSWAYIQEGLQLSEQC